MDKLGLLGLKDHAWPKGGSFRFTSEKASVLYILAAKLESFLSSLSITFDFRSTAILAGEEMRLVDVPESGASGDFQLKLLRSHWIKTWKKTWGSFCLILRVGGLAVASGPSPGGRRGSGEPFFPVRPSAGPVGIVHGLEHNETSLVLFSSGLLGPEAAHCWRPFFFE